MYSPLVFWAPNTPALVLQLALFMIWMLTPIQVMMENHKLSAELYNELPRLLSEGLITPPRARNLGKFSPATVSEAMELNRAGKVSAEKLCFEVSRM